MSDNRSKLVALDRRAYYQDGNFTARQAGECGISHQLLAHHVHRGRYERVARGQYRLVGYPGSSRDEVWRHWLSVGPERAVVSHESALELLELSDVIPSATHLLIDRRDRGVRPRLGVVVHTTKRPLSPMEVRTIMGLRVTAPARSIIDAAEAGTQPDQIMLAVAQAIEGEIATADQLSEQARTATSRVRTLIERAIRETESH